MLHSSAVNIDYTHFLFISEEILQHWVNKVIAALMRQLRPMMTIVSVIIKASVRWGFSSCQTAQMRGLSRLAISGSSLPFLTACVDLCYLRGNQGFSLVWQDYNSHRRSYERAEYKTASYSLPCCGLKGFETDNGGRTRGTVAPMKRIFGKWYEQRFGLFSTLFVFNKTFSNLDFIFFLN